MPKHRLTTARQKREISKAIADHHTAFLAETFGPDAVSPEDYDRLLKAGKIREGVVPVADASTAAHVLGTLSVEGDAETVAKMEPASFWRSHLKPRVLTHLTEVEREAIEVARDHAGVLIRGLGNKIDAKTGQLLSEADNKLRKKMQTSVKRTIIRGIAERHTAEQIADKLKSVTKDAERDWLRVAATELHNAMEEGRANAILKTLPDGSDPLVFKRTRPDGCVYCKLLYLKSDGVTPRIFRLSDLAANGTNVLRKAKRPTLTGASRTEWRAVLGAMHPWCKCQLHAMPDGFVFDKHGRLKYVGMKKSDDMIEVEVLDDELAAHECHG